MHTTKRRRRRSPEKKLMLRIMEQIPHLRELIPQMRGLTVPQMQSTLEARCPGPYRQMTREIRLRQAEA